MIKDIAKFIEYDPEHFSPEEIYEDFKHKFSGTILKINGEYLHSIGLSYIGGDENPYLLTGKKNNGEAVRIKQIDSIERVMPKTGLYKSKHGLLYLYRIPMRQWLKSLSIGSNYQIIHLENRTTVWSNVLIKDHEYHPETMISDKNNVYIGWKKVGIFNPIHQRIEVQNELFIEELKELWKQYPVTLVANLQQKPSDESLILDF